MKNLTTHLLIVFLLIFTSNKSNSQTVLNADGPGSTYELINSVFAPNGGDVVESAECAHPEFGRHIAEVWDDDLGQYVFEFYIHVAEDNDRCINFDRQRVEIKTYDQSPDYLKGVLGETIVYKWRFKIPTGFQSSKNFTHIHQVKAVGGDESDPIFVLTARKGNPDKLELNYYSDSDLSSQKLTTANISLFENTWVEATERIKLDNINGTYSLTIKKVSDGTTLMSYSNNKLLTFRADNSFIRPKWGIYRSLLAASDLRDESLRFNSFSIYEEPNVSTISNTISDKNVFSITPISTNSTVKVEINIQENSYINVDIYNIAGMHEKSIIKNELKQVGKHEKTIDVSGFAAGMYLVRLKYGSQIYTKKLLIKKL